MSLVLAVLFCIVLPGFVCAVEYWHGWSKIYNKVVTFINAKFKKNIALRTWPEAHNTVTHQFKVFCVWLAVGGILFIASQIV